MNGALEVGVGDEGCSGIEGRAVCSPDAGESGFETDSSLKIIIIKIGWNPLARICIEVNMANIPINIVSWNQRTGQ